MIIFWDCEGVDFLPRDTTINGQYYASLLHRLRSSILEKHRRKLMRGVLLFHDNAPVHKSNITRTAIQCTGFTESNHRACSPDLAPSDYYLFSNLKYFLRGKDFETDNDCELLFGECWL